MFAPAAGGMPSPGAITHAVRAIVKRAGLSGRAVQAMRHSAGSWLIRENVDVRTVAALLRHSSPVTTLNVYAHEKEGAQTDAVRHLLGANGNRMATAVGFGEEKPRKHGRLREERVGFEPTEPVKALQFSRLLH